MGNVWNRKGYVIIRINLFLQCSKEQNTVSQGSKDWGTVLFLHVETYSLYLKSK